MKSSIVALLRSLVLPYGATSGARIILDGTTGNELFYDNNGKLLIALSPNGGTDSGGTSFPVGVTVNPTLSSRAAQSAVSIESDASIHFTSPPGVTAQYLDGLLYGIAQNNAQFPSSPGGIHIFTPTQLHDALGTGQTEFLLDGRSQDGSAQCQAILDSQDTDPTTYDKFTFFVGGTIVNNKQSGAETWQTLPLANGWATDAGLVPQYRRDPTGRVTFRGRATGGATANGTIVANLPARYAPPQTAYMPIASQSPTSQYLTMSCDPDGTVKLWNCTSAFMCLDGFSFYDKRVS